MNDVTTNENLPTDMLMDEWGAGPDVSKNDVIIPKLWLMQASSKLVGARKAQMGDLVNSATGEVVGNIDDGIEMVPFFVDKVWIINEFNPQNNQFDYKETIAIDASNEDWPWSDKVNGVAVKRTRCLNFFALLPNEIKKGNSLPFQVSFRGTSLKAGKQLMTQMYVLNRNQKLPPPAKAIKLAGKVESNDKGTFAVLSVEVARDSSREEMIASLDLYKSMQKKEMKVDSTEENTQQEPPTSQEEFSAGEY
jgi:hypothetical protein